MSIIGCQGIGKDIESENQRGLRIKLGEQSYCSGSGKVK